MNPFLAPALGVQLGISLCEPLGVILGVFVSGIGCRVSVVGCLLSVVGCRFSVLSFLFSVVCCLSRTLKVSSKM